MPTRDDEFAREIQAHLDLEADRLVEDGWPRAAAEQAARRAFGSPRRVREDFHERSRWHWLDTAAADLRYAVRGLRHNRGFAATTILTLAVGLALVTVVFTVFNAYVLRPFAVHEPHALAAVAWRAQDHSGDLFTAPELDTLRARRELFDDVAAEASRTVSVDGRLVQVGFVSANYFAMLGVDAAAGRTLAASPGEIEPIAVLSEQGWSRLFERAPDAIGREVRLNGQPFTVVGVVRGPFAGLDDTPRDVWVPLTTYAAVTSTPGAIDDLRVAHAVVRLRADVSRAQAAAALTAFAAGPADGRSGVSAELQPRATPVAFSIELLEMLLPVFVAFALILATACANISSVMLTRANARHREIGVRLALGASRLRVVRQLMTEGGVIAALGGVAGLCLADLLLRVGTGQLRGLLPPAVAASLSIVPLRLDYRVFLFTFTLAALATLMFALAPAIRATRLHLVGALRGEAGGAASTSRLRGGLVAAQIAISLVVLIPAATLIRNGIAIQRTDPGIRTAGVSAIRARSAAAGLLPRAASILAADPRVVATAVASRRPLSEELPRLTVAPSQTRQTNDLPYTLVSPGYFALLDIPLVRGRGFLPEEAGHRAPVAIISAAAAQAFWPGEDPIGRTLRLAATGAGPEVAPAPAVTVVGIAQDVVSGLMFDGTDRGHLYMPIDASSPSASTLLVRGEAAHISTAIEAALQAVDRDPLAFETLTFADVLAMQMFPLRVAAGIGSLLGGIALVLSVSGLYGVLSYALSQRRREIGIRMALGASSARVVAQVLGDSARLLGAGAGVGGAAAFALMAGLRSQVMLQNVSFLDPVSFAIALTLVVVAGAVASLVPAGAAARIDPARTLRAE